MNYHFKITQNQFDELKKHLYPGDGLEAVSIAICGRANNGNTYLVHKFIHIPYADCERAVDFIKWPTSSIAEALPNMVRKNLALFKIHSHPNGYGKFSKLDNQSDKELFNSIYGWFDKSDLHGSLVLLPNNNFFGRVVNENLNFEPINKFTIVGTRVSSKTNTTKKGIKLDKNVNLRNFQTLGLGTQEKLKTMTIAVIGCSGTGSPVIEQLARLGIGNLIIVDPDIIELKNLNRIINSKRSDAEIGAHKVDMLKDAIVKMGFDTNVEVYKTNLYDDISLIKKLGNCDFLFGCMDSIDGRFLLNSISSFYLIPYIDIGVKVISDGNGGINQICGTIHYLTPGESSLQTRGVFTSEGLRASNLLRSDKEEFEKQKKSGYIVDVDVDAPAVISINMLASSLAVNEFLSRIHDIKVENLSNYDIIRFSLTDYYLINEKSKDEKDLLLSKNLGRGDVSPILNMPLFSYD